MTLGQVNYLVLGRCSRVRTRAVFPVRSRFLRASFSRTSFCSSRRSPLGADIGPGMSFHLLSVIEGGVSNAQNDSVHESKHGYNCVAVVGCCQGLRRAFYVTFTLVVMALCR